MEKRSFRGEIGQKIATGEALQALARTDDILALIGLIILTGLVVSAYGSYWQGRAAQDQVRENQKKKGEVPSKGKPTIALIIGSAIIIVFAFAIYFIMKKKSTESQSA